MADFIVTNTNDDSNPGSLRYAIEQANLLAGEASTISFAIGLNQTITLLSALPAITVDLTIDGAQYDIDGNPSTQNITISGATAFRVFFVQSGDVNFRYFTIANGKAAGGDGADGGGGGLGAGAAIFVNAGNTSVNNVNFTNDDVTGGAGAALVTGGPGGNGPDGTGGGTAGGGAGGFGGGGGGNLVGAGGNGGFGGGGGAGDPSGGAGGVGGGQGGALVASSGGGGAALGGAIFVRDGASLIIAGGAFSGDDVTAGAGNGAGAATGSDLFLMSSSTGTYTFAPIAGQSLIFNGSIADDSAAGLPGGSYTAGSAGGASISIIGEGKVVYTAGHTYSYAGPTKVTNGTLQVDGTVSASAITVQGVGTLDGTGAVQAITVLEGGVLSPGVAGIGTLTANGNVTFQFIPADPNTPPPDPGSFVVDVGNTAGNSDLLNVTGAVNLNNAHLSGSLIGAFNTSGVYTIIHTTAGVTGTFDGATEGSAVNIGGHAFQISYAANGGDDVTLTAVANGAPGLTGFGPTAKITESGPSATPQILDGIVSFNDVEGNFNGGTLKVTGLLAEDNVSINQAGFDPGEFFISGNRVLFEGTDIGGISGGTGNDLTITFNSAATSHAIDALIENLTYVDFSSTPTLSRTLTLTVTDDQNASTGPHDIVVSFDQPPVLGGIPANVSVSRAPSLLAPSATVGDPDDTTLASATVHITGGTFAGDGDVLSASTNGTSITASYDASSETLTLSGLDTLAHYQQVLESVTYQSAINDPSNAGANPTRTIEWQVNDGIANSNVATMTAHMTLPFQWGGSQDLGSHGAGWQVAGVGDFNHDGTSDVLWRNATTGQVDEWQMANGNWAHSVSLGAHPGSYQVAAIGDFDGDGTSDVLWRDPSTGRLDAWIIANGQWSRSVDLGTHGTDWQVLGAGDFDGDHTSDILFRNSTTGQVDEWHMQNGNWASSRSLGTYDPAWQFAGIGDFNNDGVSDVLWRNPTTGQVDEWKMANGSWAGSVGLGTFNPAFQAAAVNDFNGDGTSDVLWRNPTSGQVEGWVMSNSQFAGTVSLGSFDPAYRLAGSGDFDHSLTADVLWHNPTTGQVQDWLLVHV